MSDMFDLLKHSQIRKFIIMLGEREKHSRKIEIKEYEGFLKNINTVLTNFEGAVKLCKCMLISTSGSLPHAQNFDTWKPGCFKANFYSSMFCIKLE